MNGLEWMSYSSAISSGSLSALYNSVTTFFNSPRTPITTGVITQFQLNNVTRDPPFSTFSLGPTENIAIKFQGYFCPTISGDWTIHLGDGMTSPCDDVGILFLGEPDMPITPLPTFSTTSNIPSSTLPFIGNIYSTNNGNSKIVTLVAGVYYPILIYYNQGQYGYTLGLSFSHASINSGSLITDFRNYTYVTIPIIIPPIACFIKGTKILTDTGYKVIENLRNGDLIKTSKNGYKAIDMIGKRDMLHIASPERVKNQLYKCSKSNYPEISEDLIITGCHSILVDDFKNDEREKTIEVLRKVYITDKKYRLPACIDERTTVYEKAGNYVIYHLALENEDYYMNYGIYANGLLVESCSKRYLKEVSGMTLI